MTRTSATGGMVRWLVLMGVCILTVLGLVLAGPPLARSQGWLMPAGSRTLPAGALASALDGEQEAEGSTPADPLDPATGTSAQAVSARLAAVRVQAAANWGATVIDLSDGRVLYDRQADRAMIPASSLKLLTMMAAVEAVGARTTFTTRVVSPGPGEIVLVGGGDPTLASVADADPTSYPRPATSAELAVRTAQALRQRGLTAVQLSWDQSLFSGEAWHPDWASSYSEAVTPISALWIDQGGAGLATGHASDPARNAAQFFAGQLQAQGIAVTLAGEVSGSTGTELAAVHSLPAIDIAQDALLHSDNSLTEVMARQAALARGYQGDFSQAARATTDFLTAHGLLTPGEVIRDGSGLSRGTLVSASTLAGAVRLAAGSPELSPLVSNLPVAAATGTLSTRFGAQDAAAARGWLRAKTGSLRQVGSLTGYTRTADGALLAFSFIGNDLSSGDIRAQLDAWTAALTGCGCS